MDKFITRNKFILVFAALVICLAAAYGVTSKFDPDAYAITSDRNATNYNWSTMAEAAAMYLGETTSPEGYHGYGVNTPDATSGFAGNFFGYMAPGNGSFYTVASLESGNTVTYSYSTLRQLNNLMSNVKHTSLTGSADPFAWKDSALGYAGYGYALTACGIDEPVIIGQTADNKRNLIGPLVLIVYLLCTVVDSFFKFILTFLSLANPFRLFIGPSSVLRSITPNIDPGSGFKYQSQDSIIQQSMSNALSSLADTVTGLYNALYSLSFLAVIPIMIGVALFSWLVLRQPARNAFKKLAIRVIFAGLGIPLMLACYTAAIDSVNDFMIDSGTGTASSVILSTFCDYGEWVVGRDIALNNFLALPLGITLKVDTSNNIFRYEQDKSTSDRRIVQLINKDANSLYTVSTSLSNNISGDALETARDDSNLVNSVSNIDNEHKTAAIIDLLQRYTKGEYITSSTLASKWNEELNNNGNSAGYNEFSNLSNNWKSFEPELAVGYKYEVADGHAAGLDMDDATVKSFAKGRLIGGNYDEISNSINLFAKRYSGSMALNSNGLYVGINAVAPMSRLAGYNLLSSQFSDTGITVFSTNNTSTNQVQLAHYSVSLAGQGYMEVAYVLDAIAIMACLMVLGYGYGFALLFACFKGLIQIFPKILTGMIGSLKGIAGSVALIAALIIEIIGTCIMYGLSVLFVGKIYDLIEIPIAALASSRLLQLPNHAASLITVVSSCIIIIKLTQTLLHYRTAVVKAASESATAFINKFMETNVVTPNLEGDISGKDIAGAALGTAMVLSSTPSGSKLVDRATEGLGDKLGEMDGGKVASATMTGLTRTGDHGEKYTSADAKQTATSAPGGTYVDKSESSTPKTNDAKAADYVASNEDDFENEIGYAGTVRTSHSAPASAAGASSEYDQDDKVIKGNKLVGDSNNLENSGPNITGTVMSGDGTREEYQNGKLVSAYDANDNQVVDNSTEEITGTKTTDITSTGRGETSRSRATTSGNTIDSSMNKFVMTDSNGNSQDVQIVNAKTGQAYTQADKDAGVNYDVIDSNGKSVYPNVQGGMNANTLAMQNGEPTVMVGPGSNGTSSYGGGGVYQLSAPTSEVASTTGVGSAASQINQSVTQNVAQNITQTKNGESASVVIDRGSSGTAPNVNVHVAGNNGSGSMPSQTVVQQDFVQNVTQQRGSTGHMPLVSSGGGNTVVNNTTYNTQHMQNVTENTVNHAQTSNNSNINVTGGNAGSERLGLGFRKLSDNTGRRS